MSERTPIVAGNWKMNLTRQDAISLATGVADALGQVVTPRGPVQSAVFPSSVHLDAVRSALEERRSTLPVGAQNAWWKPNGAFTGETSLAMLRDISVSWLLIGHSERRHVIGESDELIRSKTVASLEAGLTTVLCIGETLDQREAGETNAVNEHQLRSALNNLPGSCTGELVIAYEPVWAIGTGKTATPEDAEAAHAHVRSVLADVLDTGRSEATRILYGGSMKPENAADLLTMPNIDGGLVGGASLKVDQFAAIVTAAAEVTTA